MITQLEIENLENRLIEAMKTSNIEELDKLIADNLVFTNQNGHLITKEDDLKTHREKNLEIYSLEPSAQLIQLFDDVAVVSVVKDISGSFMGHTYAGIFRYTRVWKNTGAGLQIIAGHISQIIS